MPIRRGGRLLTFPHEQSPPNEHPALVALQNHSQPIINAKPRRNTTNKIIYVEGGRKGIILDKSNYFALELCMLHPRTEQEEEKDSKNRSE